MVNRVAPGVLAGEERGLRREKRGKVARLQGSTGSQWLTTPTM